MEQYANTLGAVVGRGQQRSHADFLGFFLKPALRFCLRYSIGLYEVVDVMKSVLVDLAREELERRDERPSISRISVLTGVHRQDVARIVRDEPRPQPSISLTKRVIGQWEQNSRFCTITGKPRQLTFRGEDSEFRDLAHEVSTDINPAAMLAELERIGAVIRRGEKVQLVRSVEYLNTSPEKGLNFLARDVEALVRAVEENLFSPQDIRNLHLVTEYNNVFKDDVPTIKAWVLKQGQEFHRKMRNYLSRYDKDLNPARHGEAGVRVVVGTFGWTTTELEV